MVGSAITRRLATESAVLLEDGGRRKLDLCRQSDVENWLAVSKPDLVFLAAAKVGGILANHEQPADFIAQNLAIQTNIMTAAAKAGVKKLVFLGSSCIYPRDCPQPMREEYLQTGPLEETNRAYATAKLAGVEMVRGYRRQYGLDYISVLPCNLYGPNDTYDEKSSHVIAALMLKVRTAIEQNLPEITVWGTGTVKREFMHVDDCADAIVHLVKTYSGESPVNIGTGEEVTIAQLAALICDIAKYKGRIAYDTAKPDGTPRKLLDITLLRAASWSHRISLYQGLQQLWTAFSWQRPSLRLA